MTNQDIVELSKEITNVLYLFVCFTAGLYVGYLFGMKDGNDI
jgi:hypothetical protein